MARCFLCILSSVLSTLSSPKMFLRLSRAWAARQRYPRSGLSTHCHTILSSLRSVASRSREFISWCSPVFAAFRFHVPALNLFEYENEQRCHSYHGATTKLDVRESRVRFQHISTSKYPRGHC